MHQKKIMASDPFSHLKLGSADTEKLKAEFKAKMAESAKRWPKKKAKRKPR